MIHQAADSPTAPIERTVLFVIAARENPARLFRDGPQLLHSLPNPVQQLLRQGKVNGYACTPEYKGDSFVPSRITVEAKMDGRPVFTESVSIW